MVTAVAKQRIKVKRILLKRNGYQFGQPAATCSMVTNNIPGDVGCADTSIQMVARICGGKWHQGIWYSLNYIRRKSGAGGGRPLPVGNALKALRALGLDYEIRTDLTAKELMVIARNKGPVLIAEDYWAHPQWKDYVYLGRKMTGKARNSRGRTVTVGFSRPLEKSGSNQWSFRLGHMVLLATSDFRDGKNVGFVRDPNHNSASRPQRPAWDMINSKQLGRMLRSFNGGRNAIAIVPRTRVWR